LFALKSLLFFNRSQPTITTTKPLLDEPAPAIGSSQRENYYVPSPNEAPTASSKLKLKPRPKLSGKQEARFHKKTSVTIFLQAPNNRSFEQRQSSGQGRLFCFVLVFFASRVMVKQRTKKARAPPTPPPSLQTTEQKKAKKALGASGGGV